MNRWFAVVIFAAAALAAEAGAQDAVPFEFELPAGFVEVELFAGRLVVTVEPGAQPLVRGYATTDAAGPPATFQVGTRGSGAGIVRTPAEEGVTPQEVVVELVLGVDQGLRVNGWDIGLDVSGPGPPAHGPATTPSQSGKGDDDGPPTNVHWYQLTDADADIFGVNVASLVANNTSVHYEQGWGTLATNLQWSELRLRRYAGSATATVADSEAVFEDIDGDITFNQTGGATQLKNGEGTIHGTSQYGLVSVDYWSGPLTLNGTETTYELRDLEAQMVKYVGTQSNLNIDGLQGSFNGQLTGGGATLRSINGALTLTALAAARVTAESHEGKVTLNIREDSSAELDGVAGEVIAKVVDSELEAYALDGLNLATLNARVTAEVLKKLSRLEIKRSDVELDLSRSTEKKLTVSVVDDSYVTVMVDSPCRVQVRGSEDGGRGLSVSGCELQMEHTGRWKGKRRKTIDGRPPFLLTAKVAPEGTLRIQGSP